MDLWLLRHAEPEGRPASGRDADRHLTEEARRRMKAVARGIAALTPNFDTILVSPLLRTRETAEPVAQVLGLSERLLESEALLPEVSPSQILEELSRRRIERVLLVGHMPHLGRLLGLLLTGEAGPETPMRKATLAWLECEGTLPKLPASLRLLVPAQVLEKLGGAQ